ncbi:MAG: DNA repair protein RecN [Actinomycetes bacterium]
MITTLSLNGLGVIDSAELELGSGLTVLTGETGAGKTMVITSLQLLLGARASADLIRSGADRAQVTAQFDIDGGTDLTERINGVGGVIEADTVTATRVLSGTGRSRAALGGAAVPVTVLAEVGADLVAVHGQHDQSRLVVPGRQRDLLDRFGGITHLSDTVAQIYQRLRAMAEEHDDLVNRRQERLREADALAFGLREVAEVEPVAGEDAALLAEESRLAHAVDLKLAADSVGAALTEDEQSLLEQLGQLQRTLDAVREHDPRLDGIATRVAELSYLASDLGSELRSYSDAIEADPSRLSAVQERRAAITALTRKYGAAVDDVLEWESEAQKRLSQLVENDDRLKQIQSELESVAHEWVEAAVALSSARLKAARALSEQSTAELSALAMPDAELVVEVTRRAAGDADANTGSPMAVVLPDGARVIAAASGLDDVTVLLRPHRGAPLTPVQRGASGGELSRVMLAIEVVLADADPVPTVVFDEVDAGVGGAAAVEVGRRLARLAQVRQVLVVTHLPQVAAFADRHWVVRKSTSGEVTASDVSELDESGRVTELTRMLAGLTDSSSGQAHAEELLEVARQSR